MPLAGTGKTLLARAVANRTDACFIRVIGSELVQKVGVGGRERTYALPSASVVFVLCAAFPRKLSPANPAQYVGEGARMVRELFQMARSKKACLIFFDEVDAIGGARFDDGAGGDNEVCVRGLQARMQGGLWEAGRGRALEQLAYSHAQVTHASHMPHLPACTLAHAQVQRTMLEIVNQLDGFDARGNVKVRWQGVVWGGHQRDVCSVWGLNHCKCVYQSHCYHTINGITLLLCTIHPNCIHPNSTPLSGAHGDEPARHARPSATAPRPPGSQGRVRAARPGEPHADLPGEWCRGSSRIQNDGATRRGCC